MQKGKRSLFQVISGAKEIWECHSVKGVKGIFASQMARTRYGISKRVETEITLSYIVDVAAISQQKFQPSFMVRLDSLGYIYEPAFVFPPQNVIL